MQREFVNDWRNEGNDCMQESVLMTGGMKVMIACKESVLMPGGMNVMIACKESVLLTVGMKVMIACKRAC